MTTSRISPQALWIAHREAAGGASTVTGAPLPFTLDDCTEGPQATHYAMACFIAELYEDPGAVRIPPKLTPARAAALETEARKMGRSARGLAGIFGPMVDAAGHHAS